MPIRVNTGEYLVRFQEEVLAKRAGTLIGLNEAADVVVELTKHNLEILSHSRGTMTPSRPGQPPAKISGDLRDSVHKGVPEMLGTVGRVQILSELIYSAIQELGGEAGKDLASHLPARPYLEPALEQAGPLVMVALARAWGMD